MKEMNNKLMFGVPIFITGVLLMAMGFHNIDLSMNARYGAMDINGFAYKQSIQTMYLNGVSSLLIGNVFMIMGFILLWIDKLMNESNKL